MKSFLPVLGLLAAQAASAQTFTQVVTIPYNEQSQTVFVANIRKSTAPCTLFLVGRTISPPTITDDSGDIWEAVGTGNTAARGIWYAQCKGGASKVTITFASPVTFYGVLGEKSGYFDADVFSVTSDGNNQTATSATIVTASADFIVGYGWNYTTLIPDLTAGPGYVMEGEADAFIETMNQNAPGPVSSSVNYGNNFGGWWVQGIVAFKPAIPNFCICR